MYIMTLFNRVINIINRNVFLSNILLLPAFLYCIFSIIDMHQWNVYKDHKYIIYISIWYILAILFLFTIFFSTIFHGTMFYEGKKWLKFIGKIDYLITAPLSGFIILILSILYFYLLFNGLIEQHNYLKLFMVALFYIIFGSLFYLGKRLKLKNYNKKNFLKKIKYLMSHTFFHYIAYTGVSLLVLIYHLNNKEIYNIYIKN